MLRAPRPAPAGPAPRVGALAVLTACCALCACAPRSDTSRPASPALVEDTSRLVPVPIGAPVVGRPWIPHLAGADLDRDGRLDLLVCDGKANTVSWLRQTDTGTFTETVVGRNLAAPVHAEAVDIDADGDLDLLVACMGVIFPNNDPIGAAVILENDGRQRFTAHVVLDQVARVTDVRAADFDRDGRIDLAVAQFGYDQGEVRWMRNLGSWQFENHVLLSLSGAINVCLADYNGDGTTDLAALIAQQWEEVHLFTNDGAGNFAAKVIYGSTNEDFGSSGLALCDLNRDGRPDLLYTNGDGFDYADPGARPWHGVQWLENQGHGFFRYHRIGDLPGAYSPIAVDLDGDDALDVVAVSGFNDWKDPRSASLVVFQNDGRMNFTPHVLAHVPTHFMTCTVGDFIGDGRPAIVTGGFHAYDPWEHLSRVILWRPPP